MSVFPYSSEKKIWELREFLQFRKVNIKHLESAPPAKIKMPPLRCVHFEAMLLHCLDQQLSVPSCSWIFHGCCRPGITCKGIVPGRHL
jgi:hypothetical protein